MAKLDQIIIRKNHSEVFNTTYAAGKIGFEADSPLAGVYGLRQVEAATLSGYLGELLGKNAPRYALRPLWVGVEQLEGEVHKCAQRIAELGYNAVVLTSEQLSSLHDLNEISAVLRNYGLKVIVKHATLDSLHVLWPAIDYLFWEASYLSEKTDRDSIEYDLALNEVSRLEQMLPTKVGLIYYIRSESLAESKRITPWLSKLCDEMGPKTLFCYEAMVEAQRLHPFWEAQRLSPDVSATPLLPIIDAGCVKDGEGLWPVLPLDLLEACFSRMTRHHFAGAVMQVRALPTSRGLLDCNLWVASSLLWKDLSPALAAETWFKAYRPDLDFSRFESALRMIERIAVELRSLEVSGDEARAKAEAMISQLNLLQLLFSKEVKGEGPTFSDYFNYFARDARRLILHALQLLNQSIPNLMLGMDVQDSFWTRLLENPGSGIRGTAKVELHCEPQVNGNDPVMQRIFKENRL